MSVDNLRIDAKVTVVACSSVHQTLIAASTETGVIGLFHNAGGIEASPNRAMLRFPVQQGRARQEKFVGVTGLKFLEEHVLVSCSRDGSVRLWDCTNLSRVSEVLNISSREPVTAMTVPTIPGSTIIISGTSGGSVHVRDLRFHSGESDKGMKARSSSISYLCMTSNEYEVIAGDYDGNVDIWDSRSASNVPVRSMNGGNSSVAGGFMKELPLALAKSSKLSVISEDLWDVAMGKKRKLSKPVTGDTVIDGAAEPRGPVQSRKKAHHERVIGLGVVDSGIIASVSTDKSAKVFCKLTGNLLGTYKLNEKPLSAAFHAGMLCIGSRQGFELVNSITSSVSSTYKNPSTHIGHVHAVAFAGDWGVCTGGNDRHVFIHRIES